MKYYVDSPSMIIFHFCIFFYGILEDFSHTKKKTILTQQRCSDPNFLKNSPLSWILKKNKIIGRKL